MRNITSIVICGAILLALTAAPMVANAQVPARIPVQGVLSDDRGVPLDGGINVQFRLYDVPEGGAALFDETQTIPVDGGVFTAYLGIVQSLDMTLFRDREIYLGIKVEDDAEMTPRLPMASSPYCAVADYAHNTGAVPTGAVMYFDRPDCPAGWSPLETAQGRALVGLPSGGTLGAQVGVPLEDQENRQHNHTVDPAAATTDTAGAHVHTVDPDVISSANTSVPHTHNVNPPSTATNSVSQFFRWSVFNAGGKFWQTWNSAGALITVYDWGDGMDSSGAGHFPVSRNDASGNFTGHTETKAHSHNVNIPVFSSGNANITHAHDVDIAATPTSNDGDHAHAIDLGPTVSSGVGAADSMPYIQLLVCRKD